MRKLLFALLLMVAAPAMVTLNVQSVYASSGGGTKIPASQVPKAVKKNFHQSFPTATQVEWEFTAQYYGGNVYTASFNMNGQKWEASFNTGGTLLSSGPKA